MRIMALATTVVITSLAPKTTPSKRVVPLLTIVDTRTDTLWGLSNVFFERATASVPFRVDGSTDTQIATIVEGPELQPVRAVRWKTDTGGWAYAVDTNGDSSFADETPLAFAPVEHARDTIYLAGFSARVQARDGAGRIVPLQFVVAGNYTYVRPRETRLGVWDVGGTQMTVRLRPRSRNDVLGRALDDWEVAIDLNADGRLMTRRDTGATVSAQQSEEVGDRPFFARGQAWRITTRTATAITIVSADPRMRAVSEGFLSPALPARTLHPSRAVPDLTRSTGDSLTVIEFWATDCPYSEQSRPALNALRTELTRAPVRWFSIARDRNDAAVDSALTSRPRLLVPASVTWADWLLFNPRTITPTYLVFDSHGRVLLAEAGASRIPLVRGALIAALRASTK